MVALRNRTREAHRRDKRKPQDELRLALSEKDSLTRRVEDSLREIAQLREKNQLLEAEMAKVARVGKREEMDFAEEARTWAGVWISDKLPRNGDFILSYRAPNGDPTEPKILIDNKDKSVIAESDIDKLVRDARNAPSVSPHWSPAMRHSFDRLTENRDGAARTESGCSELPGSGLFATSTFSSRSSSGCECRASICWTEMPYSPRNFVARSPKSTASSGNWVRQRRRSSPYRRSSCDTGSGCAISATPLPARRSPRSQNWIAMFAR